ncbi:response regulator transcription factor [Actinophytocola xanthii]|uniref:HTH luxR-type domain-containing protein n=1 Tax=Actinophytocola xanthii TaxID=1912961 RepID=A0A1Q8BYX4_9PSEU|nr:LuxR C-terminal-related transcriptional regulator [Actinophytocola xanthii]OLF07292.1 hypothetical protein BU204_35700 [Actinophytocola xanthii]OLF07462.1 hypothetical protein BU204_35560 [Actinophytocola xanthii]
MLFRKAGPVVTLLGIAALAFRARRAATAGERIPLPDAARQAWQLVGALVRPRHPGEATAFPERGRAIAVPPEPPDRETRAAETNSATVSGRVLSAGVTRREHEVLRLVGQRLRNREIAERLHLSERTVETHVSSLLAKTGLPNRIELGKFVTEE